MGGPRDRLRARAFREAGRNGEALADLFADYVEERLADSGVMPIAAATSNANAKTLPRSAADEARRAKAREALAVIAARHAGAK